MTLLTTLLEVFPGWPVANQGSAVDYTMLLFVGPLALGAVLTVLFNAGRWSGRAEVAPNGQEPQTPAR